jgi:Flp pilus assembly protein TadD
MVAESPKVESLDDLLVRLADPEEADWENVQNRIIQIWSRSGSDSMDLLLTRGREAMRDGDLVTALHHLGALVDHAPDFAEGWNARATAFFMHGEYGLALADIERVLALEPRHFGALTGLGLILDQLSEKEAALAAYRETLKLNPHIERIREAAERLSPEIDGRGI